MCSCTLLCLGSCCWTCLIFQKRTNPFLSPLYRASCHGNRKICRVAPQIQTMIFAEREQVEVQSLQSNCTGTPCLQSVMTFLLQSKTADTPRHVPWEDYSNQCMDCFWMFRKCITPTWSAELSRHNALCISTLVPAQKERKKDKKKKKKWHSSLWPLAASAHKLPQLSYGNYITWDLFNISIREKKLGSLTVTSNQRVLSWWAAPHHGESSRNLWCIGFK